MSLQTDLERVADELPVPIYVTASDGTFLYANARLRALLDLPPGDLSALNIANYYSDPQVRMDMISAVRGGAVIEKRSVRLRASEREIEVLMFCREVRRETGQPLGFLGVLLENTHDAEFRHVFDAHLTAGVYRVDADDRVTHANAAFASMLGFKSVDEVLRRDLKDFCRQAGALKDPVRESVQFRRDSGETFAAYLTAIGFLNAGQYAGQGGIVEDRTIEERYMRIFDDVPVGFYSVETDGDRDIVRHCNLEFARIHDLPSRDDMIGRDIRTTHLLPEESARFLEKLRVAAKENDAVRDVHLQIRTALGVKTVEVHSRPRVVDGKMIGRTGAIRDITDEVEMKNTLTTMFDDLSGILHTFKHTLEQLTHSVVRASDALAVGMPDDLRRTSQTPEELEANVRGPLRELASAVTALVNAASSAHAAPLERDDIREIERLTGVMQRATRELEKPHWRDAWLKAAVKIDQICSRIRSGTIARSTYRPVIAAAQRIAHITALATLGGAREAIEGMNAPLTALRDFATSGVRTIDQTEVCWIEDCIRDAINNVTGFAEDRKVQIRFAGTTRTPVKVARREVARALNNLLHNAIKYSWRREDGKTWISVSVSISDRAMVVVAVENWGVPIPENEIEHGLIFRLGYRGRLSSDRGRLGTGVGLADSLRVTRAHRGALRVESRPAASADPHDYELPFLTTAYFELPLAREAPQRR